MADRRGRGEAAEALRSERREPAPPRRPPSRTPLPRGDGPRIEITPSPAQYEELCRHLGELRSRGAASNTAAILAAVRDAAEGARVGSRPDNGGRGAYRAPRPSDRR